MRRFVWLCLVALLIVSLPLIAQLDCPTLVEEALQMAGDNCNNLERNSVCYGYDRIDSIFTVPQPEGFFTQQQDRASLLDVTSLHTAPFNNAQREFGVAILNIQANVPETLPGQAVIFMMVGDTSVSNAVDSATALQPGITRTIRTVTSTPLYSQPTVNASVRSTVDANAEIAVDGILGAGTFARVIHDGEIVWAEISRLDAASIAELPIVEGGAHTPMQAFYFTTGIGQPTCREAEPMIAVQSPEGIQIEIAVNGVDIRMGSLVTLTNSTLTVHRGHVATSLGQTIEANITLELTRDANNNIIGLGTLRPISDAEFARGELAQAGINAVAEANGWEAQSVTSRDAPTEDEIIHIVQVGENLFSIARLYNASVPAIVARNGLAAPDYIVVVGQVLRIPRPGSGFVGLPFEVETVEATTEAASPVDCRGFASVSGGTTMRSNFTWTAAPGADEYKVNLYGDNGRLASSIWVKAPTTQIELNMGEYATGGMFQWEVEALLSGRSYCTTSRTEMLQKPPDLSITPLPPGCVPVATGIYCVRYAPVQVVKVPG
jgi:LysM repeat protein